MSDIAQYLLTNFYGFGSKNKGQTLPIHEGLRFDKDQSTQNIDSIEPKSDITSGEVVPGVIQSLETNLDKNVEENNYKPLTSRSWRAVDDDEDLDDEERDLKDEDLILDEADTKEIHGDHEADKNKDSLMVKPSTTSLDRHDSPRGRLSSAYLDDNLQDTASDVSSRSARKRERTKSSFMPLIAPVASESKPFHPPIIRTSPTLSLKAPIYNELFCDMAKMAIEEFPIDLLDKIQNIKMLYLENNYLKELPGEIFAKLTRLQWLDARNNQLKTLPPDIKNHTCLETILLQGNQIERLPLELCLIPSLKSIHLANNPLVFPHMDVVALGFKAIMEFLRNEWNTEHPDEIINAPGETESIMTVLSHKPPKKSYGKRPKFYDDFRRSSRSIQKVAVRERAKNYRPSNRCRNNGEDKSIEEKFRNMCKLRENLIRQNHILQKIKDKNALKNWRKDEKSFKKSMIKAAEKKHLNPPYGISNFVNQPSNTIRNIFTIDINKKISDIAESLRDLHIERRRGSNPTAQLSRLETGVRKLKNIKKEIEELKKQNDTSLSLYECDNLSKCKDYQPLPSIIM